MTRETTSARLVTTLTMLHAPNTTTSRMSREASFLSRRWRLLSMRLASPRPRPELWKQELKFWILAVLTLIILISLVLRVMRMMKGTRTMTRKLAMRTKPPA